MMCKYLQETCPDDNYYEDCMAFFGKCSGDDDPVQCNLDACSEQNYYCDYGLATEAKDSAETEMMSDDSYPELMEYYNIYMYGTEVEGDSVMATTTVLLDFCNTDIVFFADEDASMFKAQAALLSGSDCSEMGDYFDLELGCYTSDDIGDCGAQAMITYSGSQMVYWIFSTNNAVSVAASSLALFLLGSTAF